MSDLNDLNADRHQKRGVAWLAAGNAAYAEGSYRKAARNREKVRLLDAALGRPHGPPTRREMVRQMHEDTIVRDWSDRMAAQLLFGGLTDVRGP